MTYEILRDEGALTITPDDERVRKFLTLHYRQMTKANGKTTFDNLSADMFEPFTSSTGQPALRSYQGFWQSLALHLQKGGKHTVVIKDVRPKFARPRLKEAMIGLRDFQKDWMMTALMTGDSGLIGMVTRGGKTWGMTAICRAFPDARTAIIAPGIDLCEQHYEHFCRTLPHRDVRGLYTGSKNREQGPDITIVSMDSMFKLDPDDTPLIIIDEPHAVVSDERLPELAKFHKSRKYGLGATLTGRFDKKDRLIEGLIGPILSNITYKEGVEMGAVAPLKVIMIKIPFSKDTVPGNYMVDRAVVYKRLLTKSARVAKLVKQLVDDVIPQDWQMMAFIMDEAQADYYMENAMPAHGTVAMAKKMTPKVRKDVTARIASGELVRVIASNIYVQGVTFPDLRVVINLAGGGANTTAIQKPGRLLQAIPGKNYGVMIDFVFECKDEAAETRKHPPYEGIIRECWARHAAYKEIGYDIEFVSKAERAAEIIRKAYGDHPAEPVAPTAPKVADEDAPPWD